MIVQKKFVQKNENAIWLHEFEKVLFEFSRLSICKHVQRVDGTRAVSNKSLLVSNLMTFF